MNQTIIDENEALLKKYMSDENKKEMKKIFYFQEKYSKLDELHNEISNSFIDLEINYVEKNLSIRQKITNISANILSCKNLMRSICVELIRSIEKQLGIDSLKEFTKSNPPLTKVIF